MSYKINNIKNALHGFFLSLGIGVAEPSTILPLIIHHFSSSMPIVGLFASLLRGGAIVVQLFAAFYAQSYERVLPLLRWVFFFRFLSWFLIGVAIITVGEKSHTLTLWLIGVGLFFFSFSAGFGGIYFKEIIAKAFTKEQRGKTMAERQLVSAIGSLLSGIVAGYVLQNFEAPQSYAYLFMLSAFIMLPGFVAFGTIEESAKKSVRKREESFGKFLKNAIGFLIQDKRLRLQIIVSLLGYTHLFALPFVILKAKESVELSGWMVGGFITVQMFGSITGNFFIWRKFGHDYIKMLKTAYFLMMLSFIIALFAKSAVSYALIFMLFGMGIDGFRNADMNLVIEIAPEDKRPVYVAVQSTLVSFGLFFPILGGYILEYTGYESIYLISSVTLFLGIIFATILGEYMTKEESNQ